MAKPSSAKSNHFIGLSNCKIPTTDTSPTNPRNPQPCSPKSEAGKYCINSTEAQRSWGTRGLLTEKESSDDSLLMIIEFLVFAALKSIKDKPLGTFGQISQQLKFK
jgi:hypothetical protein